MLAAKYKSKRILKENRGRRCKELNEDEKIWFIEFLSQIDTTYNSLGRKERDYIRKFNSERK